MRTWCMYMHDMGCYKSTWTWVEAYRAHTMHVFGDCMHTIHQHGFFMKPVVTKNMLGASVFRYRWHGTLQSSKVEGLATHNI